MSAPALREVAPLQPAARPTIARIKAAVAEEYGVSVLDLESDRRSAEVARPRQAGMWLCRRLTGASLPRIGRAFGDRDHTTVLHANRAVEARLVHPEEYERMARLMEGISAGEDVRDLREDRAAWALREIEELLHDVDVIRTRLRRMVLALEEAKRQERGG